MCGIAGYWATPGLNANAQALRRMCDQLDHRGPDAYGAFVRKEVALGHRRLSIIDVAGGSQPLGNEDGSVQIIFNGEIYNYRELRRGLVERGHRFTTESDTEVLVHLYEEVGERLPEHLNGMFAFAIWDSSRDTLFLCRDRLGKKPLYYSTSIAGTQISFASELKALTVLPDWKGEVNPQAVSDFLALSYVPDPQTIYRDVFKLPPGHSLLVTRAGAKLREYWRPNFDNDYRGSFANAVEEIQELAQDSVTRRLVSDVPLGAFLSGGVDSSAVVGYMARAAASSVKTFSIGFDSEAFDERAYAREAASLHRTRHEEEVVSLSEDETLQSLAWHFDEPFGDSSAIPMLHLARMTRRHVTVALSGDGADELFGGYRRYRHGIIEHQLRARFPGWFRHSFVAFGARCYPKLDWMPQVFRAKTLLGNLAQEIGDAYFTSMSAFRDAGLTAMLATEQKRRLGGYSPRAAFRERFQAVRHLDPLRQMQAVDFQTYLPGDILVKADRATMAHSLEGRSPWLDYRLVELAATLPSNWKVKEGQGKYIFKKAVAGLVPEGTLTRGKMGFSVPLDEWLRTSLTEPFQRLVMQERMEQYVAPGEVRRLWREHQSGLSNHGRKLWNLLMLAAWDERHVQLSGREQHMEVAAP